MRNRSALLLAWAALGGSAAGASAQWASERWVSLVEMPVAVTRLEVAGVPLADLSLFVPALNVTEVQPMLFLETMRGVPVMQQYYVLDDYDAGGSNAHPDNHGGYVQYLLSRGLRGTALADAIHGDLGSRGIVAKSNRPRGVDVLSNDYVLIPVGGSPGNGVGRGQNGQAGRGASEANGRARSLGDDLRARKGGPNGGRPALEPRGRGPSVSPGNPGRGGSSSPAAGRGRGGDAGGGNGNGGGNGGGRGQGGGRGGRGG